MEKGFHKVVKSSDSISLMMNVERDVSGTYRIPNNYHRFFDTSDDSVYITDQDLNTLCYFDSSCNIYLYGWKELSDVHAGRFSMIGPNGTIVFQANPYIKLEDLQTNTKEFLSAEIILFNHLLTILEVKNDQ